MSIVGIIPARGGSKGIHRKNLTKISNVPLIGITIMAANKSKYLDRIIVSTDDSEISKVAESYGAEVPFERPKNISTDTSKMIDVLKHALLFLVKSKEKVNAIVLLQPTSPLRNEIHIDEAIELFIKSKANSVVSVIEVPHQFNPHSILSINEKGELKQNSERFFSRRQDKPKYYARNGPAILIIDSETIMNDDLYGKKSIPYFMSVEESLDIDTLTDLEEANKRFGN